MKKDTEANRGGMFVLSDDEVKQIEQIAGTSCFGAVSLLECRDGHSEIYDNFGLAAYLSPEQTEIFFSISTDIMRKQPASDKKFQDRKQ